MRRVFCLPLVYGLLLSCGSENAADFDRGGGALGENAELRQPYPAPPYGTRKGAVIENFRFLGWSNPKLVDFDTAQLKTVSLADFYDPSGAKGISYLVVTSTAVWCGVCRLEYDDFRQGQVEKYSAQGVEFLGALFEDNDAGPARPRDLELWADLYDVAFPFVLDPGFALGAFFDRASTPVTMVLDARTMEILWLEVGWAVDGPRSVWAFLDSRLGT